MPNVIRLFDGGAQREGLECDRDTEDGERDARTFDFVRVPDLLDAFVQREQATHAEQHKRDDERPEVTLGSVTEWMRVIGRAFAAAATE